MNLSQQLENDLAALIARHEPTGEQFVEACHRVAQGYFEPDELPPLDLREFGEALAQAIREAPTP